MTTASRLSPPLFTRDQIAGRVEALAADIARDYGPGELSVVAILKGAYVFTADLARALARHQVHPAVDFMSFSSYGNSTTSSRDAVLKHALSFPVAGRPVLLVDDILDTGLTIQAAKALLAREGAASIRVCVLLDKPARREAPITADYTGFQIDNLFVVGYGLDYDNRYRELPDLHVLVPDTLP